VAAAAQSVKEPPQSRTGPAFLEDLPISSIVLDKNVRELKPEDVEDLARSIEQVGVLNPVDVSMGKPGTPGDLKYTLVAGHRRVAAAKLAKLKTVPARVFELTPQEVVEFQLTENLQRKDLSELEEARAFKDYVDAGHTQVELAKKIGKSAPYVANRIRLLGLPEPIVKNLEEGKLTPSHAEVFLQLPKEATPTEVNDLVGRTVRDGESVRQLADRVRWKSGTIRDRVKRTKARADAIASSKFPVCPVKGCGGKGQPDISYDGKVGPTMSDRSGHTWSRKNGELIKSRPRSETRQPAEPPKPTLPLVDANVACPLTPDELWQYFYTDSTLGIERFRVTTHGSKVRLDLSVVSNRSHPNSLPSFQLGRKDGFVEMDGAGEWAQRTDSDRKRKLAERTALEQWLAALAKKAATGRAKK
jgi:ParB family transcriptional regulator, chromosome partitioning protein